MNIDKLLEKPYWIVDILPERVPKDSAGQYFAIEEFYLREPQASALRKRFANVILKLNCYYDISFVNDSAGEASGSAKINPNPEDVVKIFAGENAAEYICIPVGTEDTLIVSSRDYAYLTVYNPTEHILELIRLIAEAEGLFVWKPGNP